VAIAYGLGTPAFVYATLGYGHQAASLLLLASLALLWRQDTKRPALKMFFAGFFAAAAAVVELQVGLVSAILAIYLLAQVLGGQRRPALLGDFAVGALVPTIVLLLYNQLAFGSPFDLAYFHEDAQIFHAVHNEENPLGLRSPVLIRYYYLIWGGYRGLLFYAPITLLAIPGFIVLLRRKLWGMALIVAAVTGIVYLVNVSYPLWTGGWSTGPRFLLPMLPFAMLPVAALLGLGRRWVTRAAIVLAIAGSILMLLFVAIGGRIRQEINDPLLEVVWPHWAGRPLQQWELNVGGTRFARNLVSLSFSDGIHRLPESWQWIQVIPLVLAQGAAIAAMLWFCSPRRTADGLTLERAASAKALARSDLGIDQQQDGGRDDQDPDDPATKAKCVVPDALP
jgi:hypothetical protein